MEEVNGEVALCMCICVYVRWRFFCFPQREKSVSYLSLCFKGGMKAIFEWHLQSRSTWTQSAPVRPKWTMGEFLWLWRKLNANHTKHSHSHTSIKHSHMVRGNKSTKIGHRLHPWRDGKQTLLQSEQHSFVVATGQKGCGYEANHTGAATALIRCPKRCLSPLCFPHDCWWHSCRDVLLYPLISSIVHKVLQAFISLNIRGHVDKKRLTLMPLGRGFIMPLVLQAVNKNTYGLCKAVDNQQGWAF